MFVKEIINQVLLEHLTGVEYEEEHIGHLSKLIANTIRKNLEGNCCIVLFLSILQMPTVSSIP